MSQIRDLVLLCLPVALLPIVSRVSSAGVNYEEPPINYSSSDDHNPVSRLRRDVLDGRVRIKFEPRTGYLKSLLDHFEIPVSSQVLTFAKTSLQKDHIGPASPRAIYFNDEVHIGYVQNGLIEIAVADPQLGMVFYTAEQNPERPIDLQRRTNSCLTCHGAARTQNVPGLMIRSVFPDQNGQPVIAAGSFLATPRSPLHQRWGGWYVTGEHGAQTHLGNYRLSEAKKPARVANEQGQNRTNLTGEFDTEMYLSPHSDIVALIVLEHQTDTLNAITRASFEVRHAIHEHAQNSPSSEDSAERLQKTIDQTAERLTKSLLFFEETQLTAPLRGTSTFAVDFAARAKRDSKGRSLRDFDLTSRLFRYPCSYLIESAQFANAPETLRQKVYELLNDSLSEPFPKFGTDRLTTEEREATLEILIHTVPDWPVVENGPQDD